MEQLLRDIYYALTEEPILAFIRGFVSLLVGSLLLIMAVGITEELGLKLDDIFKGCLAALGIVILSMLCGALLAALIGGVPQ